MLIFGGIVADKFRARRYCYICLDILDMNWQVSMMIYKELLIEFGFFHS